MKGQKHRDKVEMFQRHRRKAELQSEFTLLVMVSVLKLTEGTLQEREVKTQMASIEAAARQAMAMDKLGMSSSAIPRVSFQKFY